VNLVKSAAPSTDHGKRNGQVAGYGADGYLFAHISDPHLSTLEGVSGRDLLNKRLLGYFSWLSHRREEHRTEVLAALVSDLKRCHPQHTVITGDLTHLGLPAEFQQVAGWLASLGPPEQFTVIPGNHEAYVRTPWEETFARWLPYLDSDTPATAAAGLFPSLRLREQIAFIGLSSASPSVPLLATGNLGKAQLQTLDRMLAETGARQLFRVLLIHHPPLAETLGWRKRLTDSRALRSILQRQGVELVLHGHAHRTTQGWIDTVTDRAPVIGVPSASAIGHKPGRRARYNLCRVSRTASGWTLRIEARSYDPKHDCFVSAGRVLDHLSHRYGTNNQDGDNRHQHHQQGAQIQHESEVGQ